MAVGQTEYGTKSQHTQRETPERQRLGSLRIGMPVHTSEPDLLLLLFLTAFLRLGLLLLRGVSCGGEPSSEETEESKRDTTHRQVKL